MRLYRRGDSGEAIRDIQQRLADLGHPFQPDPSGEFGHGSDLAVRNFQAERGLDRDGIVGPDTWRSLYEAGYQLGDRILYRRSPMLRGDDVAQLQRRLNNLGFDADKVDGIFGPRTHDALLDFQMNRGMAEDGVAGPVAVRELRSIERAGNVEGRETVREREWMRLLPATIAGARIYLDPAVSEGPEAGEMWQLTTSLSDYFQKLGASPLISRSIDVFPPAQIRARRANRLGAQLCLSLAKPDQDTSTIYYFESNQARSHAGHLLASCVAQRLNLPIGGRASAMLKGTRAPSIVTTAALTHKDAESIGLGVVDFFAKAASEAQS